MFTAVPVCPVSLVLSNSLWPFSPSCSILIQLVPHNRVEEMGRWGDTAGGIVHSAPPCTCLAVKPADLARIRDRGGLTAAPFAGSVFCCQLVEEHYLGVQIKEPSGIKILTAGSFGLLLRSVISKEP